MRVFHSCHMWFIFLHEVLGLVGREHGDVAIPQDLLRTGTGWGTPCLVAMLLRMLQEQFSENPNTLKPNIQLQRSRPDKPRSHFLCLRCL